MHALKVFFIVVSSFVVGSFCLPTTDTFYTSKSIQIVKPVQNHSFELNLNELSDILGNDEIKDRDLVVVSVTGAFRGGKSFLLNFFLRYLTAQVAQLLLACVRGFH